MTDDPTQAKGNFKRLVPEGDNFERLVCADCGFINYENPKIVVGSVVREDTRSGGKILLCRRAINPRKGYWTLPAGFMEQHETAMEGAQREAWEEANAKIAIDALLAVYSIPRLSQVQLIYRAHLAEPGIAAGPESEEVGFFAFDEIPWNDLAFPSVHWALGHDRDAGDRKDLPPFVNPPGEFGDLKPAGL
jgi:ADP-ribose pyrophosphatase YjhB (NUDIX family)